MTLIISILARFERERKTERERERERETTFFLHPCSLVPFDF